MLPLPLLAFAALLLCGAAVAAPQDPLDLEVGDPSRRHRTVQVTVDRVVDTATGQPVLPDDLGQALRDARLVLVGERHTSREAHRVQRRVIDELLRAGRPVMIGLEMFPYTEQASLDRWVAGDEPESRWLETASWYEHWGYHFGYYREIFDVARARRLRIVALNAPRSVISAVGRKGLDGLTPDERRQLPDRIDIDSPEHMTLFKAYLGSGAAHGGSMPSEAWQRMLGAQAAWDATMAHHAVAALKSAGDPRTVMVVLAGSGHVAYGLGIERQAGLAFDGPIASIIPVAVGGDGAGAVEVRASYANYVWGVPAEPYEIYPSLGLSTRTGEGRLRVLSVEPDGCAGAAGVKAGDVLLAFDGTPVRDRAALSALVAAKDWGDAADLRIERDGDRQTVRVVFARRFAGRR
ncbi:MAG TPA: ChaN family lipoprotein [Vicinamibacterales bacterium]